MKIEKAEYEELLRDSERLRIIGVLVDANCVADVNDAVMLICGYAPKEKVATAEKTFAECIIPDNAESEIDSSCAKKKLCQSEIRSTEGRYPPYIGRDGVM